ncbi:MAG: hypothetical protein KDD73_10150 [Anaerolineales bacterium]|nr:hypothetical protein [Anaerolineales bacterium]MCB9127728.1 hypothetical protein [Ardenticatenales bacterium]
MRKLRSFAVLFVLALAMMFFANSGASAEGPNGFSTSAGPTSSSGQMVIERIGMVTITHSVSQDIVPLNSVSCNSGGSHTDNSYFRRFDLADDFGITGDFDVTNVEFGIETAQSFNGSQPVTVRLWSIGDEAAFTLANVTLVTQEDLSVANQDLTIYSAAIAGTIAAGDELVVEVFTPNGQAAGDAFFIGSNPFGETDPSYLLAPDCGVTTPTSTAAIGFPDMHIVMNVIGDEGSPTAVTIGDLNTSANGGVPLAALALGALGLTLGAMAVRRRRNG